MSYLRAYRKAMTYFHDTFSDANGKRRDGEHADEVAAIAALHTQQPVEVIKKGAPYVDPQGRIVKMDFAKIAD